MFPKGVLPWSNKGNQVSHPRVTADNAKEKANVRKGKGIVDIDLSYALWEMAWGPEERGRDDSCYEFYSRCTDVVWVGWVQYKETVRDKI